MRWLLAAVLGYSTFAAVYLPIYRRMYMADAACDQPCRDLGDEVVAQVTGQVERKIYKAKCEPLSLKLELLEPKVRASWKTPLWYRVTMTNVSCRGLGTFRAEEFLGGSSSFPSVGYDIVRDTDEYGGVIRMEFAGDGDAWEARDDAQVKNTPIERIIPYKEDYEAFKRMKSEFGMLNDSWFDLQPGQQVQTASPMLFPHRYIVGHEHALNSGVPAIAELARKKVFPKNPGYQKPPPGGYRNLFLLHPRKGRFRVVYQNGSLHTYPKPRFSHSQLQWASYPLLPLKTVEFLFDVDFQPTWRGRPFYYRVTAASNWVDFEATP